MGPKLAAPLSSEALSGCGEVEREGLLIADCIIKWLKKEANSEVLATCIVLFGQQGPSKLVAERLKLIGCQYGKEP